MMLDIILYFLTAPGRPLTGADFGGVAGAGAALGAAAAVAALAAAAIKRIFSGSLCS